MQPWLKHDCKAMDNILSYKPGWSFSLHGTTLVILKGNHSMDSFYPKSMLFETKHYTYPCELVRGLNVYLTRQTLNYCTEQFNTFKIVDVAGSWYEGDSWPGNLEQSTTVPSDMTLTVKPGKRRASLELRMEVPNVTTPTSTVTVGIGKTLDYPCNLQIYRATVKRLIQDMHLHEHQEWFKIDDMPLEAAHPDLLPSQGIYDINRLTNVDLLTWMKQF